ncbi:hypothetical protein KEJ27_08825 [Candidatus Bathyarchaeota archaeon]|nr:hypothetical protein [Candidatus Bathyarchaeota archaeon]MBS7613497.1 hypothetical protein [Candidatus Bathyarchaeota archaeon]MBS7617452.1 hypothetical protein [Candidatus Bathyarchaeota archaeon]
MNMFKIGIVVVLVGVVIAVIPFREEVVPTEQVIQASDWTVSWYSIPTTPTDEGFEGFLLGYSTAPFLFSKSWQRSGMVKEEVFGGFYDQVGFIAKADVYMPVDGFVVFEIGSGGGCGSRLYVDGDLTIDLWMVGRAASESAIIELKAGDHKLEFWWYVWSGESQTLYAIFETDQKIMVLEKKSDLLVGLTIACVGIALTIVSKLKSVEKPRKT